MFYILQRTKGIEKWRVQDSSARALPRRRECRFVYASRWTEIGHFGERPVWNHRNL